MNSVEFDIGDTVLVRSAGELYSSYKEAARLMNLKNFVSGKREINYSRPYIIINKMKHLSYSNIIYGITDDVNDFVIHGNGLKLVEKSATEEKKTDSSEIKFEISSLYNFSE